MIAFIDGDVTLYQACWGNDTLKEAKLKLDEILQSIVETIFCDDYLIAVGGPNNWRESFYVDYKKSPSRLASKKNKAEYFDELKAYLASKNNAVLTDGFEADDLIRMWTVEAEEAGDPFVLCTIDKDLDCVPGNHFNFGRNEKFYVVTPEQGDTHYWKQILMGDAVDNIPGLPKVGPVTASKILEGCDTRTKRKEAVIEAYKQKYGDEWKPYLLANGRLIHIWKSIDDHFMID
jgi:5'-3' exonuclease